MYAVVGNCNVACVVDATGDIVWMCLPTPDGQPVFDALVDAPDGEHRFAILSSTGRRTVTRQRYLGFSPVLTTTLYDDDGNEWKITDFAPRWNPVSPEAPPAVVRILEPVLGTPVLKVHFSASRNWGRATAEVHPSTSGLRVRTDPPSVLVSDLPPVVLAGEQDFVLDRPVFFVLETEAGRNWTIDTVLEVLGHTLEYWKYIARHVSAPLLLQESVLRSALAIKLCSHEPSGGVLAALTTSIPEAFGEGRNWDYRYVWLRDAWHSVDALRRLGYMDTSEHYVRFLTRALGALEDSQLPPLYDLSGRYRVPETEARWLRGFMGDGPVRFGNDAWHQQQNDGWGSVFLSALPVALDRRTCCVDKADVVRLLYRMAQGAARTWSSPDAGIWEIRGSRNLNSWSVVMCWAAIHYFARFLDYLGRNDDALRYHRKAARIRSELLSRFCNGKHYTSTDTAEHVDATLLLWPSLGIVSWEDRTFRATLERIESELVEGPWVWRYRVADDFGQPTHPFVAASFWYASALAHTGRVEEATEIAGCVVDAFGPLGIMSEHYDPDRGLPMGNFPQTYSHVGLVRAALDIASACGSDEAVVFGETRHIA